MPKQKYIPFLVLSGQPNPAHTDEWTATVRQQLEASFNCKVVEGCRFWELPGCLARAAVVLVGSSNSQVLKKLVFGKAARAKTILFTTDLKVDSQALFREDFAAVVIPKSLTDFSDIRLKREVYRVLHRE